MAANASAAASDRAFPQAEQHTARGAAITASDSTVLIPFTKAEPLGFRSGSRPSRGIRSSTEPTCSRSQSI